ncbi:MAG: DUF4844 domain-containing protein [Proteobacteria bacterium]|nr:DUF4844 domain-containing protein [Pseudomonadota bacterium]
MRAHIGFLFAFLIAFAAATLVEFPNVMAASQEESVHLTSEIRTGLMQLKAEKKFEPHDYPPGGYTGIATPEEGIVARAAVNKTIDAILTHGDGPIGASFVSDLIKRCMQQVDLLETEDRDRTAEYMIEVWYLLGFKGTTGRFAYGSAYQRPPGYGEPLPPGWQSPTKPRPIGQR